MLNKKDVIAAVLAGKTKPDANGVVFFKVQFMPNANNADGQMRITQAEIDAAADAADEAEIQRLESILSIGDEFLADADGLREQLAKRQAAKASRKAR